MDVEAAGEVYGGETGAVVFEGHIEAEIKEPTVIERSPRAALFPEHLRVIGEAVELLSIQYLQTGFFLAAGVVVTSRSTRLTSA